MGGGQVGLLVCRDSLISRVLVLVLVRVRVRVRVRMRGGLAQFSAALCRWPVVGT
ncbi:hypothetical protein GCM10027075_54840 [Streptomyces heilongjiangensis]